MTKQNDMTREKASKIRKESLPKTANDVQDNAVEVDRAKDNKASAKKESEQEVKAEAQEKSQPKMESPTESGLDGKRPINIPLTAVVVDDEPANRDFLVRLIQQAQYDTHGAASGAEAIKLVEEMASSPTVLMIDSQLPDTTGDDLIKKFRAEHPNTRIIMATMFDERSKIQHAFESGCDAFLVKPHGFMELFKRLQILEPTPESLHHIVFNQYGVQSFR